jgi:predicted enzyme related to lactoylglutathione lyase
MSKMGMAGTYLIFGKNGVQRGGIYNKPVEMPAPPNWLPYVRVPSADRGYKSSLADGARQMLPPMDVPGGGRIAGFFDPTGAAFAIHSMTEATETAAHAAKPKAKAKAKPAPAKKAAPKKKKAAKKPAPKKKVVKKAAKKVAKKSAPKKKSAAKKKGTARRKK